MQEECSNSVLVVLLTGLPGAGKSTFLESIAASCATESESDRRTLTILRLDDYLRARSEAFDPVAWRAAASALFEACESTLMRLVQPTDEARPQGPATVFVEDNMHLRSMRERFWKLCKRATAQGRIPVAMIELRFAFPTSLCLERNGCRVGTPSFIPTHVVRSLAERFEHCLETGREDDTTASTDEPDLSPRVWIVNGRSTQPWLLLSPSPGQAAASASPHELVRDFTDTVASPSVRAALEKQRATLARSGGPVPDELQQRQVESGIAARSSAAHRLDLALRTVVRCYFASRAADRCMAPSQASVQLLKKTALTEFKRSMQSASPSVESDEMMEDAVAEFEARLLLL